MGPVRQISPPRGPALPPISFLPCETQEERPTTFTVTLLPPPSPEEGDPIPQVDASACQKECEEGEKSDSSDEFVPFAWVAKHPPKKPEADVGGKGKMKGKGKGKWKGDG